MTPSTSAGMNTTYDPPWFTFKSCRHVIMLINHISTQIQFNSYAGASGKQEMMIKTVRQTVTEASDVTDNTDDTSTSSTDSARERREGPRSSTGTREREREREMNECRWTGGDRGKTFPPKYGEVRGDIREKEKEMVVSRNQPLCVTSASIVSRNRDKCNERDSITMSEKEKEKEKSKDRSFAGILSSANCTSSLVPLLPVPRTVLVGHGHQKSKSVEIYDTSFNLGTKLKQTVNPMFTNTNKLNLDTTFTPVAGKPPQLTPRRKLNSPQ